MSLSLVFYCFTMLALILILSQCGAVVSAAEVNVNLNANRSALLTTAESPAASLGQNNHEKMFESNSMETARKAKDKLEIAIVAVRELIHSYSILLDVYGDKNLQKLMSFVEIFDGDFASLLLKSRQWQILLSLERDHYLYIHSLSREEIAAYFLVLSYYPENLD